MAISTTVPEEMTEAGWAEVQEKSFFMLKACEMILNIKAGKNYENSAKLRTAIETISWDRKELERLNGLTDFWKWA